MLTNALHYSTRILWKALKRSNAFLLDRWGIGAIIAARRGHQNEGPRFSYLFTLLSREQRSGSHDGNVHVI